MTHASATTHGKWAGLLRGALTRFVTRFCSLHHLFHQKRTLLATDHSAYFTTLAHNAKVAWAVQDIKSNRFLTNKLLAAESCVPCFEDTSLLWWKQTSHIKEFYLCDRAQNSLLRSECLLSDHSVFGFLEEAFIEGIDEVPEEVFGVTKKTSTKTKNWIHQKIKCNFCVNKLIQQMYCSHF